mgnify:CR=1 FL=1
MVTQSKVKVINQSIQLYHIPADCIPKVQRDFKIIMPISDSIIEVREGCNRPSFSSYLSCYRFHRSLGRFPVGTF